MIGQLKQGYNLPLRRELSAVSSLAINEHRSISDLIWSKSSVFVAKCEVGVSSGATLERKVCQSVV